LLYLVSERHKGVDCPGKDAEFLRVLASKLSKPNQAKKSIKIIDGFVDHSCVLQTGRDHVCIFIAEANSPSALVEMFKPLNVEVTPTVRWQQGFESKIKQTKIA
jgi:hypothetical protein